MSTTVLVNTFDGGMTNDPRDQVPNVARISEHVDNNNIPHLLTPYPDNDFNAATDPNTAGDFNSFKIKQFLYNNSTFFGLGVSTTTIPAIYTKATVGGTWALGSVTGDYASLTALGSASDNIQQFIFYQNYLYGLDGGGWWKYGDITSSPTWTRSVDTTSTLHNVCKPVVHSFDDCMYFGGGAGTATANKVVKNSAGTFSVVLTFGTTQRVAAVCELGIYLAIAVNNADDTCDVYLWDRSSILAGITTRIPWGSGTIKFIENLQGTLVGASTLQSSTLVVTPQVVFKYYNGTAAVTFQQFTPTAATIYEARQKFNNLVYFLGEMTINSISLNGVWKIAKAPSGQLSVSMDRLPRLDDVVTAGGLFGFLRAGDYFHIGCLNAQDSDKYVVTKTSSTFSTTAIYRTTINPNMPVGDHSYLKRLEAVWVSCQPLAAGEGVVIKYRVDGGIWTTVLNETTDDTVVSEALYDSSKTFFTPGYEYEFSIEPSGGAKVSELKYRYSVEPK